MYKIMRVLNYARYSGTHPSQKMRPHSIFFCYLVSTTLNIAVILATYSGGPQMTCLPGDRYFIEVYSGFPQSLRTNIPASTSD
jgi:hypothetical protein